jgi:hypothetical protein
VERYDSLALLRRYSKRKSREILQGAALGLSRASNNVTGYSFAHTGFYPWLNGFQVRNFTSTDYPDGHCEGMVLFSLWYFRNQSASGGLFSKYMDPFERSDKQYDSGQNYLAFWSHDATYNENIKEEYYEINGIGQIDNTEAINRIIQNILNNSGPVAVCLVENIVDGSPEGAQHAVLAYAYSDAQDGLEDEFRIYDPNYSGDATRSIKFNGSEYIPYSISGWLSGWRTYKWLFYYGNGSFPRALNLRFERMLSFVDPEASKTFDEQKIAGNWAKNPAQSSSVLEVYGTLGSIVSLADGSGFTADFSGYCVTDLGVRYELPNTTRLTFDLAEIKALANGTQRIYQAGLDTGRILEITYNDGLDTGAFSLWDPVGYTGLGQLLAYSNLLRSSIPPPTPPPATNGNWIDFANISWYTSNPNAPSFTISSAEDLAGLAQLVNVGYTTEPAEESSASSALAPAVDFGPVGFSGRTLTLTEDIDLSGKEWTPINSSSAPRFYGTFDGGGHTIWNMTVNAGSSSSDVVAGLFSYSQGTIKNVNLINFRVSYSSYSSYAEAGGIVGRNGGSIESCTASSGMKISASAPKGHVSRGGFIGHFYAGTLLPGNHNYTGITAIGYDYRTGGPNENIYIEED